MSACTDLIINKIIFYFYFASRRSWRSVGICQSTGNPSAHLEFGKVPGKQTLTWDFAKPPKVSAHLGFPVGNEPIVHEPIGNEPVGHDPEGNEPVGHEPEGDDQDKSQRPRSSR